MSTLTRAELEQVAQTLIPAAAMEDPNLLATGARDSTRAGICVTCRQWIRRGERVADLVNGGVSHVPCC
jgi:hypothetical protein